MRLIDADALLEEIKNPYQYREVAEWINGQPTIEAQPERTGYWIEFPNHNAYICSECSRILKTTDGKNNVYRHYPYCHCGARMVKEGEEQNESKILD